MTKQSEHSVFDFKRHSKSKAFFNYCLLPIINDVNCDLKTETHLEVQFVEL